LRDGYFGFLKDQGDWKTKFKGKTLKQYTAAVTDFAEFTVRQKVANDLVDAAKKSVSKCIFPKVGGFQKAYAMLNTEPVVISGDELPLEMSSLFGGVGAKSTYEPEKLLEAMSELFDRTNKALSSIVKSFEGAKKNKQDIEGLTADIEAT